MQKLKQTEEMLERNQEYLDMKYDVANATAKKHARTNKRLALQALKRRKCAEQQLRKIDGALTILEFQREALENVETNIELYNCTMGEVYSERRNKLLTWKMSTTRSMLFMIRQKFRKRYQKRPAEWVRFESTFWWWRWRSTHGRFGSDPTGSPLLRTFWKGMCFYGTTGLSIKCRPGSNEKETCWAMVHVETFARKVTYDYPFINRGLWIYPGLVGSVRNNVLVNSKTAHPPPPGNPRAFDSREAPYGGEFDPKWGPPGGAFDFRVKTSFSGRKQKDFAILWFNTWAAFLSIPRGYFCCCRFI